MNKGRIIQIIGSTFDAEFFGAQVPSVYNAVKIKFAESKERSELVGEVQ